MRYAAKYFRTLFALILLGIASCAEIHPPQRSLPKKQARYFTTTAVSAPTAAVAIKQQAPRTRILFTGDINLGRCIARRTLSANVYTNNFNYPFEFVDEKLRSADITVGSLDSSLSNEAPPMECPTSMNLIAPTRMAEGLQFAGFDVITIATNHVKDCGVEGFNCDDKALLDTIETLKANGIQPVGAGKTSSEARQPVIIEQNGIRFAFLGISQIEERVWAGESTPGTAPLSPDHLEQIKADIAAAKQIADVVIVLPHWGVEYAAAPDAIQHAWAKEFIDAGAALVIGNHPHIIQQRENFSERPVFYALGNFVFDQGQSFRRESIVVEVNFTGDQIESTRLLPVSINYYTQQPHWAEDSEARYILTRARTNH